MGFVVTKIFFKENDNLLMEIKAFFVRPHTDNLPGVHAAEGVWEVTPASSELIQRRLEDLEGALSRY